MCGIVAVLPRRRPRQVPAAGEVAHRLDALATLVEDLESLDIVGLERLGQKLADLDSQLQGPAGVACLLGDRPLLEQLEDRAERLLALADRVEARLDQAGSGQGELSPQEAERSNAARSRLRDYAWSLVRDRVRAARSVAELSKSPETGTYPESSKDAGGRPASWVVALWAVHAALSALDRLEVRGRDSAGLVVLVDGHGLDTGTPPATADTGTAPGRSAPGDPTLDSLAARLGDRLFGSRAVRQDAGRLVFVYKAAAEIGELGDNTRVLRAAIAADALLARALAAPGTTVSVLAHTRWASVGGISEANAHPLEGAELDRDASPFVTAALNGDVDNHHQLAADQQLAFPPEITTDAKVIPALLTRELQAGAALPEAFNRVVNQLEGSVAVAAASTACPDRLAVALRGSGQALYVGLAHDAFVVASEAYGLVEEADRYLRLDGEAGEVVLLDQTEAGTLGGITRSRYDATPVPVAEADLRQAAITTRDIDRRGYPHFFLKEINEAPQSFRKTLLGKVVAGADGHVSVRLGPETIPTPLVAALRAGRLRRAVVIGQGTAAVAGQAVARALAAYLQGVTVDAEPATELSAFGLRDDMSDTLVVAVSQSGTTTDTNRTVDLARSRGAWVVAVVNRRNSDLTEKAHGVLYTSDGRDVEMSVASTKAFYAQVAAGYLLALGLAEAAGQLDRGAADQLLQGLRSMPSAMERVLADRFDVAQAAAAAPSRRSWAVVGSGPDRIAAAEIRIKLSELCYKSIACDATEDKKHIDLSSEPLIVVCASAPSGATADDVAKEVAIYRAHKALPVVIAATGQSARFAAAHRVLEIPAVPAELSFVLAAMVGHLFGYEAALAIDSQARPLRTIRAVVEGALATRSLAGWWERLGAQLAGPVPPLLEALHHGDYNGHLEVATALRLSALLRYATGGSPIDGYEVEFGRVGSPAAVATDLLGTLSEAIGELSRPIDAIKHQAKTVTVGVSRREDDLVAVPLVKEALAVGLTVDTLGYRALRALAALDPAVHAINGYSRYRIDWAPGAPVGGDGLAAGTISLVDQGGVAQGLRSRTLDDHRLRGTKHRVAVEREVTAARGRSDGRSVIFVPETKDGAVVGMTLLHVRFAERLPAETAKAVLRGYRGRYAALTDAVTETEDSFDDRILGEVPFVDLLSEPVYVLAERWRRGRP